MDSAQAIPGLLEAAKASFESRQPGTRETLSVGGRHRRDGLRDGAHGARGDRDFPWCCDDADRARGVRDHAHNCGRARVRAPDRSPHDGRDRRHDRDATFPRE
jgi:hypothetical protein